MAGPKRPNWPKKMIAGLKKKFGGPRKENGEPNKMSSGQEMGFGGPAKRFQGPRETLEDLEEKIGYVSWMEEED